MPSVFIINGHGPSFGSPGALNAAFADRASGFFVGEGYEVQTTTIASGYDVREEILKFQKADVVFLQMPINWMGAPWAFKKYVDEVWMAGMMGPLSSGDGRTSAAPKKNYGLGGKLTGRYMISLTGNAPKESFNDPAESFFAGMSEDDLLRPMHLNFKWIGLQQLPSFMAYDVMKNPEIESDFQRFDAHLKEIFRRYISSE
ncbi:NAD(P)H-dependent oxidoreductase [Kaistia nematophila]|uniref:NAD(P)H-dependent oxidoreductase n=1 Tax=Kaistia nematophila TaxID=2994654 RepID=A0A9X3IMQ3_9HYPH|nr:NAD(P)H-dependent oxidoreductase [Kaistia nematophila]MCX5572059.1 NAD(P)H-dependent oxidoreductase [Kaistia nematophila]